MKLKLYFSFILSIVLGLEINAQITIDSSDLYVSPDTINIVKTNNAGALDIKSAGNQTWDFRSLKADSVQQIRIRNLVAGNPIDNKFKDAKMVLERPGEGNAYLVLTKDSLNVDGFADFVFDPTIKADVDLEPNLKLMELPITYLDAYTARAVIDSTRDTNALGGAIDSVRVVAELDQTTTCDAYGKLITVQTSFNTIRLRTVEKQTTTVYLHQRFGNTWTQYSQTIDTTNRYTWLAKGRGYQVAEVTTDGKDQTILTAQYMLIDSLFGYIDEIKHPNCMGESNGSASFKKVIGSSAVQVDWGANANNQQTFTAINLAAGTYVVTITDNKTNETFTDTAILIDPPKLTASVIASTPESESGKDGKIEVLASGGTPPYKYTWDKSPSTKEFAEGLEGGKHTITVKDEKGCTQILIEELSSSVGIVESSEDNSISIFPNPSNSLIRITGLTQPVVINIVDITGALVLEKAVNSNELIDVSSLQAGIYFLNVDSPAKTTLKLIIE